MPDLRYATIGTAAVPAEHHALVFEENARRLFRL
jgi:hypothetical protein